MKKFFSFAIVAFAAVAFVACGNSAPKLEGTEVAKKYFTFIQPTGWEMEGNGADENKVVLLFEDSVKYRVTVEANDHCGWEHEIGYYTGDTETYKALPAEQDIVVGDATFKGFQKNSDLYTFYMTKLTNADEDGDGKLTVSISTNKYDVDPLQNPIFKDFIANVKLNVKEGAAKAE